MRVLSQINRRHSALLGLALFGCSLAAHAEATSGKGEDSAAGSVTVRQKLNFTSISDIDFGTVIKPEPGTKLIIDFDGATPRYSGTTPNPNQSYLVQATRGQATLEGDASTDSNGDPNLTASVTLSVIEGSCSPGLKLSGGAAQPATDIGFTDGPIPAVQLNITAKLTITANELAGSGLKSCDYTLNAAYNL